MNQVILTQEESTLLKRWLEICLCEQNSLNGNDMHPVLRKLLDALDVGPVV